MDKSRVHFITSFLRVLSPLQPSPEAHRITSLLLPHLYSKACIHNLEPTRLVIVYCARKGYEEEVVLKFHSISYLYFMITVVYSYT